LKNKTSDNSIGAPSMAREGKGKVVNRGGTKYPKIFIYIPKSVAMDTSFPFKEGEDVIVRIEGDQLIIKRKTSEE
jgi:hypothetical protein